MNTITDNQSQVYRQRLERLRAESLKRLAVWQREAAEIKDPRKLQVFLKKVAVWMDEQAREIERLQAEALDGLTEAQSQVDKRDCDKIRQSLSISTS